MLSPGETTALIFLVMVIYHYLVTRGDYSYTQPQFLAPEFRHGLLLKELDYLDGDIVCLQEVSPGFYNDTLLPAMKRWETGERMFWTVLFFLYLIVDIFAFFHHWKYVFFFFFLKAEQRYACVFKYTCLYNLNNFSYTFPNFTPIFMDDRPF